LIPIPRENREPVAIWRTSGVHRVLAAAGLTGRGILGNPYVAKRSRRCTGRSPRHST
jgi:hypothetical protein